MKRYYPQQSELIETTPFSSSEEAWFWCCLCESLGEIRGRGGHRNIVRPCEASDIIIAVKKLVREHFITQEQAKILLKYGKNQMPPHPHFGDSPRICKLWQNALNFLDFILKKKGIVA